MMAMFAEKLIYLLVVLMTISCESVGGSSCENGPIFPTHSGTLTSPSYPNSYDHNLNCSWTISVNGASQITLNVTILHIEPDYDHLYARSKEIKTNGTIEIPGNEIQVRFTTDGSVSGQGWIITWIVGQYLLMEHRK
ncbi:CUB domain-containing protein 2-like [Watersipora subatra]|uniref:CUB domain-containing protein 2-like n=1 Tax=Watersipora subatra TaxID=2589382 RepID=UPI00355C6A79